MTLDEQINDIMTRIQAAAKKGDIPRVRRIIRDLLEPTLERDPVEEHRARLADIGDDAVAFARYLGELGQSDSAIALQLGGSLTAEQQQAVERGRAARQAEARAIELAHARAGGKMPEWALRLKGT